MIFLQNGPYCRKPWISCLLKILFSSSVSGNESRALELYLNIIKAVYTWYSTTMRQSVCVGQKLDVNRGWNMPTSQSIKQLQTCWGKNEWEKHKEEEKCDYLGRWKTTRTDKWPLKVKVDGLLIDWRLQWMLDTVAGIINERTQDSR